MPHAETLTKYIGQKGGIFCWQREEKIEWKYIKSLYEYSKEKQQHSHKLTRKHIEWERNPMNVRLAAQTSSNSVADSLKHLMQQKHPDFQGAGTTIDFARRVDKLFNIFNSRKSEHANIFKRVLSSGNKKIVFDFFSDNIKYFKKLKIKVEYSDDDENDDGTAVAKYKLVPLLKSRSYCGFRGFIIDMVSLMEMFTEYVEQNHLLTSIATYNMLQDVIEMLFGRIRACGGFNNNPNVHQFKGI